VEEGGARSTIQAGLRLGHQPIMQAFPLC
jgi:hypothetical protein